MVGSVKAKIPHNSLDVPLSSLKVSGDFKNIIDNSHSVVNNKRNLHVDFAELNWKPEFSRDISTTLKSGAFDKVDISFIPEYEHVDVQHIADGIANARTPEVSLANNALGTETDAGKLIGAALVKTNAENIDLGMNYFPNGDIPHLAEGLAQTKAKKVDLTWDYDDEENTYKPFGNALAQNTNDTVLVLDDDKFYPSNRAEMLQSGESAIRDAFYEATALTAIQSRVVKDLVSRGGTISSHAKASVTDSLLESDVFKNNPELTSGLRGALGAKRGLVYENGEPFVKRQKAD